VFFAACVKGETDPNTWAEARLYKKMKTCLIGLHQDEDVVHPNC
jgi:hypothetical protein